MAIAADTLSGLYQGAEKSAKVAQNLAVVDVFATQLKVLPCTAKAAQHYGAYGALCVALEEAGRPIALNDLHMAALARSEGLTLVINILGKFERVSRLGVRTEAGQAVPFKGGLAGFWCV